MDYTIGRSTVRCRQPLASDISLLCMKYQSWHPQKYRKSQQHSMKEVCHTSLDIDAGTMALG